MAMFAYFLRLLPEVFPSVITKFEKSGYYDFSKIVARRRPFKFLDVIVQSVFIGVQLCGSVRPVNQNRQKLSTKSIVYIYVGSLLF